MASTIGIKLDDQTKHRLRHLGEARDRTPHWLMRVAIQEFLDREEQYEREKSEDLARWEQYLLNGHAVAHDVIAEWLGSLAQGKRFATPK